MAHIDATSVRSLSDCVESLAPIRARLLEHPVHRRIRDEAALRVFMEHHVWAVWDFMAVLKRIQARMTCVQSPWVPVGDPEMRRFVNQIVLLEESDESSQGVTSHFELYRLAMKEVGADPGPIDRAIAALSMGARVDQALAAASSAPGSALDFSRHTLSLLGDGSDAAVVGVFTLSREELIPDLFRSVVSGLGRRGGTVKLLLEYLERHVEVDETDHGPMSRRMVESVCGDSRESWNAVLVAAEAALRARVRLWDGALAAMDTRPEPISGRTEGSSDSRAVEQESSPPGAI